jgi:hypothetical protein
MTEDRYRVLETEIAINVDGEYLLADPGHDGYRPSPEALVKHAVMPIVARELAARDAEVTAKDAVIEQIWALAEEWRANSRRCNRCANDLERLLSSLPSTEASA